MKQGSLSEVGFVQRKRPTRRAVFLGQMEAAVPWGRFEALILPHYPVAGKGRRPYPLGTMLRLHLMQQWFGLSDPAMEEALWETPLLRGFAGIELGTDRIPDETTILNFRHLLERHELGRACPERPPCGQSKGAVRRDGSASERARVNAARRDMCRCHIDRRPAFDAQPGAPA